MATVLLAMSGGVDSSVSAALLQREGWTVVGCFMRLGSPGEELPEGAGLPILKIGHQGCCSIEDAGDARRVAGALGISFYVLNFKRDFGRVIEYFAQEYDRGRTPNPCIRCNDWLKFGRLLEFAHTIGAERVATGHYARIGVASDGGPCLMRGAEEARDQSYFLFGTPRKELARLLLPVGDMPKPRVRELAAEFGLRVAEKPDSQEICFVPGQDYAAFLASRDPGRLRPGPILDQAGGRIGEHQGHQRFTIGQRRGTGVSAAEPRYVVAKDAATNTIVLGPRDSLAARACVADGVNWMDTPVEGWRACRAKVRSTAPPAPARVRACGADRIEVEFDRPQEAIAPGQAVVCYDGDRLLCGGFIERAEAATVH